VNLTENVAHMTVTLIYLCDVQLILIYAFLMTETDVAQVYATFDEPSKMSVVYSSCYLYHSYRFYYP
jgi:hypothetical protein